MNIKKYLEKLGDSEFAIQTSVFIGGLYPCGLERIHAYRTAIELAEVWKSNSIIVSDRLKHLFLTIIGGRYD